MTYPKFVNRNVAAKFLQCHPRTLSRLVKVAHIDDTAKIPFKVLVDSLRCHPDWLVQCINGLDYAVPLAGAATALWLTRRQVASYIANYEALKPVAFLQRGPRFSAKALGLMKEPLPANHPANPMCEG